jgi:hypothetical protein
MVKGRAVQRAKVPRQAGSRGGQVIRCETHGASADFRAGPSSRWGPPSCPECAGSGTAPVGACMRDYCSNVYLRRSEIKGGHRKTGSGARIFGGAIHVREETPRCGEGAPIVCAAHRMRLEGRGRRLADPDSGEEEGDPAPSTACARRRAGDAVDVDAGAARRTPRRVRRPSRTGFTGRSLRSTTGPHPPSRLGIKVPRRCSRTAPGRLRDVSRRAGGAERAAEPSPLTTTATTTGPVTTAPARTAPMPLAMVRRHAGWRPIAPRPPSKHLVAGSNPCRAHPPPSACASFCSRPRRRCAQRSAQGARTSDR